jgi:hypothetical protein
MERIILDVLGEFDVFEKDFIMSGGHFDYIQYRFNDVIEEIKELIESNNIEDEYGNKYDFSELTLDEFEKAIKILKLAIIYVQRIDWLVSGDDGEETFHERIKEDLIENEIKLPCAQRHKCSSFDECYYENDDCYDFPIE